MTDSNSRPPIPPPPSSVHAQRRASGGPRHAASEQVTLRSGERVIQGWTLNVSRGGARLIVEDPVAIGDNWELRTEGSDQARPIRVVWVRDEAGGQIIGVQYLDSAGTIPPFDLPADVT
ncbi:MAG: PilZ domain-containing protein [Polyangiaceae bacterium]